MLQNKRFYLALIGLALLFALTAQSAFAQASNIASSKHNFSSTSTNTIRAAAGGTTQICVFCHTPHGATSLAYAPLWNKVLTTVALYALYTSDYLGPIASGGLGYPAAVQPKEKSRLCLSCHDGTVALGSVYNLPGSGTGAGTIPMTGVSAVGAMPTTAVHCAGLPTSLWPGMSMTKSKASRGNWPIWTGLPSGSSPTSRVQARPWACSFWVAGRPAKQKSRLICTGRL